MKKMHWQFIGSINTTKNRFSVKDNKDVYNMIFTPWFVYVSKTSFKWYTNNEKKYFPILYFVKVCFTESHYSLNGNVVFETGCISKDSEVIVLILSKFAFSSSMFLNISIYLFIFLFIYLVSISLFISFLILYFYQFIIRCSCKYNTCYLKFQKVIELNIFLA